jgi:hypothetical protein
MLSPEVLAKREKRLKAEGRSVPRWITDGRKRNSC